MYAGPASTDFSHASASAADGIRIRQAAQCKQNKQAEIRIGHFIGIKSKPAGADDSSVVLIDAEERNNTTLGCRNSTKHCSCHS